MEKIKEIKTLIKRQERKKKEKNEESKRKKIGKALYE